MPLLRSNFQTGSQARADFKPASGGKKRSSDGSFSESFQHLMEGNMRIKVFIQAMLALTLLTVSALAQTGRIEGEVLNDKGEPIVGAKVQIVRTDIKGNYDVNTDKKGKFIHAGVPYVGRYTLIISAPGYDPAFQLNVRPEQPLQPFKLAAGSGRVLTIEEVNASAGASKNAPAGAAAPKMSAEEEKKRKEEYERLKKENEDAEKFNASIAQVQERYKVASGFNEKKDYASAVNEYREALKLNEEIHQTHGFLAQALYNRGVTQFNAGQKDAAKQDFAESAQAAQKALEGLARQEVNPKFKNDPAQIKQLRTFYVKSSADSAGLLVSKFYDASFAETADKSYKALVDLTDDPAKKKEYLLKRANMLREGGKIEESIVAYKEMLAADPENLEALYWLGIAYSGAEKTWQDSANTLQAFVDKAPDTDPRKADAKAVIGELLKGNNIQPPKSEKGGPRRKKP
jgi:tetratricopeptide (TPR) repeat protein